MSSIRKRLMEIVRSTDRPTPLSDAFATAIGADRHAPRRVVLSRLTSLPTHGLDARDGHDFYGTLDPHSLIWLNEILGREPARINAAIAACQATPEHETWAAMMIDRLPWHHLRRHINLGARPGPDVRLEPPQKHIPTPYPRRQVK